MSSRTWRVLLVVLGLGLVFVVGLVLVVAFIFFAEASPVQPFIHNVI